jgi:hypothetical protein
MISRKLLAYLILTVIIVAALVYGIRQHDPQDMRIEASSL